MHPFMQYILKYQPIHTEEWKEVEKCLTRKEYAKGDILLSQGKICKKLFFLEEGFPSVLYIKKWK